MGHVIRIAILGNLSHSKGWGRYRCQLAGVDGPAGRVVKSSTGNEWVSAGHEGAVSEGARVVLTAQVQQVTGRMNKRETTSASWTLVAAPGESCEVEHRPGSQGIRLRVDGARVEGVS